MTFAVLLLLWVSALSFAALVVVYVYMATHPVDPGAGADLVDLERYRQSRAALERLNSRHSISTVGAARAGYGNGHRLPAPAVDLSRGLRVGHGLLPPGRPVSTFDQTDACQPGPRSAHAGSTLPSRVWRDGSLVTRST